MGSLEKQLLYFLVSRHQAGLLLQCVEAMWNIWMDVNAHWKKINIHILVYGGNEHALHTAGM